MTLASMLVPQSVRDTLRPYWNSIRYKATRRAVIALVGPKRRWGHAQGEELQFWDRVLETRGGQWADDFYPMRYDPQWPLQEYLCELLAAPWCYSADPGRGRWSAYCARKEVAWEDG